MSTAATQPHRTSATDPRVEKAIEAIVSAMALKPSARKQLRDFVADLIRPFPKLAYVSFYAATTKAGKQNFRATFAVPGYKKRTDRLGRVAGPAYQRAKRISEVITQVKARLMKPEEAHRLLYVDTTPIETHVKAFEQSLRSKGSVKRYVNVSVLRLRRMIELAPYERLTDIKRDTLSTLTAKLKVYVDPAHKKVISPATINDYLAVLRQFTKWATPILIPVDPLVNSGGIKVTGKQKRRDVLPEELGWIVKTARSGRVLKNMTGEQRAMLYLAGYATGLRYSELMALEVPWLKLDAERPYIAVPAEIQKVQKEVRQPLPAWFVAELKQWLGDRKSGRLWPKKTQEMSAVFNADRERARTAWIAEGRDAEEQTNRGESDFLKRKTSDGVLVFHSLRHAFSTQALAKNDIKTAQLLTRHATASLLTDTYAHSRLEKAADAVELAIVNPLLEGPLSASA